MVQNPERAAKLAARVAKLVALRRSERAERKIATVLFNFPPNAGTTGTAAYLGVFASLHHTLTAMKAAGYTVEVPENHDVLREMVINGNREQFGTTGNVGARIDVDSHVRRTPWLEEIEAVWGPAPGRIQTNGRDLFVLGVQLGNVFVGVQPGFGYEGDPMRLLFEGSFAPTHAFTAFYRWLAEDFGAHAVLHFGTHGALEFMPGKQAGMSATCWPDRLIGELPNFYLYASNNPSEGMLAKRRAGATLVSYLTPPVASAGRTLGAGAPGAGAAASISAPTRASSNVTPASAAIAFSTSSRSAAGGTSMAKNLARLSLTCLRVIRGLWCVLGAP